MIVGEVYYERKYGIRTTGFKTSESNRHHHYQAAAYTVLDRILRELAPYTRGYTFYDIGCGKGRVLFRAADFGFKKLCGIELDGALLEYAKSNLEPLLKRDKTLDIELIQKNALECTFENQAAVYFLFNPFNAEVLNGFIERVLSSNKEMCYFVYMNPVFSSVFEKKQMKAYKVIRSFLYTEAIIYRWPSKRSN